MDPARFNQLYQQYKPLLFSIAYRMLGTVSDAEDIVQDVFLHAQLPGRLDNVEHVKSYLCKMTTNRCLDVLKAAHTKREVYTGTWLPEPLLVSEQDPLHEYVHDETISFAILTLLDKLTPVERAVFILREAFELPYETIADTVGKSPQYCRKILSRLRPKLLQRNSSKTAASPEEAETILRHFLHAAKTGDMDGMIRLLGNEAVLYSDGGGKVSAALRPITSPQRIAAFLSALTKKALQQPSRYQIIPQRINGSAGLLIMEDGAVSNVFSFSFQRQQISAVYIVRNPDKLAHLHFVHTCP